MRVLTVNAGSSSLKLALVDTNAERALAERELQAPGSQVDPQQLDDALAGCLRAAEAIGHRIVHGGPHHRQAACIDARVRAELEALSDLAPLHQAKSLSALRAVSDRLPHIPAVACFDTAFHATLPAAAATYALPAGWRSRFGLRRYGFHGLSHAWVARHLPRLLGAGDRDASNDHEDIDGRAGAHVAKTADDRDAAGDRDAPGARELRIVSCHLGAGASLCAIAGGRSIDTTMGFTPLEGLVMATRSGSLDPGMLLWLIEHAGLSASELAEVLEHRSGLLGLAGSADMREIVRRAHAGEPDASLAFAVYIHRLQAAIAAMTASLGGLDALVFTGGVGERSPAVRAAAAAGLRFLGVKLDGQRNHSARGDADISAETASARTFVVQAREDLQIAREVDAALTRQP